MIETTDSTDAGVNVACHLARMAQAHPFKRAVVCPAGRDAAGRVAYAHLSFQQLDRESDRIAHGLLKTGIGSGTRTILMVRPGLEFFSLIFALFKVGAVPVVVDPGMGVRRMLECFRSTRPQAFVGIPLAHAVRSVFRKAFKTVRYRVTVGRRWFWGGPTLNAAARPGVDALPAASDPARATWRRSCSPAAAPGRPRAPSTPTASSRPRWTRSARIYDISPARSTFPRFRSSPCSTPALGMTAVVPEMDPTRPAQVGSRNASSRRSRTRASRTCSARPALLERRRRLRPQAGHPAALPEAGHLRRRAGPGAARSSFSPGCCRTAPRSTPPTGPPRPCPSPRSAARDPGETRPLTEQGAGVCVGRPVGDIDRPHHPHQRRADSARWSDDLLVPHGEIGEIAVQRRPGQPAVL